MLISIVAKRGTVTWVVFRDFKGEWAVKYRVDEIGVLLAALRGQPG